MSFAGDRKSHLDGRIRDTHNQKVTAGKSICRKVADKSPKSEERARRSMRISLSLQVQLCILRGEAIQNDSLSHSDDSSQTYRQCYQKHPDPNNTSNIICIVSRRIHFYTIPNHIEVPISNMYLRRNTRRPRHRPREKSQWVNGTIRTACRHLNWKVGLDEPNRS